MKIVAIGAGNIAHHLITHLYKSGHEILQVGSRSIKTATALSKKVKAEPINSMSLIRSDGDIYIMMVPDDMIKHLSSKLPFELIKKQIICHTSGSIESTVLDTHKNYGVFYPLQTFSKKVKLDYSPIPFFITANNPTTEKKLKSLARKFSKKVKVVDDSQRGDLHIAAVFVNNFVNYVLGLASDISKNQEVNFKHLHPLLKETINKALKYDPNDIQTGPAKRNDKRVLKEHLQKLKDTPDIQKIYKILSQGIQKKYQ
jgi:predicted short-subunit dehydrogenase-like oxidoreductase (DUF2520 family)